MNNIHYSSEKNTWETPELILGLVRQIGPIGLDPCTTKENPTGAKHFFTPEDDGLSKSWAGYRRDGLIYVNPPYGRGIKPWITLCAKACVHNTIIALVPARVDTKWFSTVWKSATSICFWQGRLKFKGAKNCAPFPSAMVYWGEDYNTFKEMFDPYGAVIKL